LNLRDLRYLVAVADCGHFGRAAATCFVSQPTLSMQVRKLEDELGVPLIERLTRGIKLTPVGEQVVERARRVLREVADLERIAHDARDPFAGELRLGVIPTVAPFLLPRVLPPLRRALPKLGVLLTEAQTASLLAGLESGALDCAVLALPAGDAHLEALPLYEEPFLLALPRRHPLAARRSVRLGDLDGLHVLLLEDGHCLRDQALAICGSAGAVENANFRATGIETLRQMVRAELGVTLMPALAAHGDRSVRYVPFTGEVPGRTVGLAWRASSTRRGLLSALAAVVSRAMQQALQPDR
jgi:LysR family hydrogen peroxide-inducible transcriptional activator